jgi:hypothetical protein
MSPATSPAPSPAPPAPEREPFEARLDASDAALPLDGTHAVVTVQLANMSSVVDGYVIEAVEPPEWLGFSAGQTELLPGTQGTVSVEVRIASAALVPAQQADFALRVRNTTGRTKIRDLAFRVTVPPRRAPLEVRAEPQVVRVQDSAETTCMVVVGNPRGNTWTPVHLSAVDPEHVVSSAWASPSLQVPPGGQARSQLRLSAPPPPPGAEVSRTVTITADDGHERASTTVTLVQTTSRDAIEQVALRLDPSVLRLGDRRRGSVTALVDNRRGTRPATVSLHGDDPENTLRISVAPRTLQVAPGATASARVSVEASRTPPGTEVTRPFTVVASDGRTDTHAQGSVVQLASSNRGLLRVGLIVLGAFLVFVGTLMPFNSATGLTLAGTNAEEVVTTLDEYDSDWNLDPSMAEPFSVLTIGLVLWVLAGLMLFGLTSRTGRLTRVTALVAAVLVVGALVGLLIVDDAAGVGSGVVVLLLGCASAYAGGLLSRR